MIRNAAWGVALALAAGCGGVAQAQDFTTAAEIKPILTATKANWIALREYEGQDLLYFTQLESWRCGLSEVRYGVNGAAAQVWTMDPCFEGTGQPNGLSAERVPYTGFALGSVAEVSVTVVYDDGSEDSATYPRAAVLGSGLTTRT